MFYRLIKANKEISRLMINVVVLEEHIRGTEENRIQSDESVHKENFIKFLSDSRDWAYEYIETVQEELKTFINSVKPDIDYFDEYGAAGPIGPNNEILQRISLAYKHLIKLMPDEDNK
jgi:hypothetical protein